MKKAFLSLLVLAGLGGFAQAGGSKYIVEPAPAPIAAPCYGAGFEFGGFVGGWYSYGTAIVAAIAIWAVGATLVNVLTDPPGRK